MEKIIKVPLFTDYEIIYDVDETIDWIDKNTVVMFEFYHELKPNLLDYLNKKISKEEFLEKLNQKIWELRPEFKGEEFRLSKSHNYILEKLIEKEFYAFETLEHFNYRRVDNLEILQNMVNTVKKYKKIKKFAAFMAVAHSGHIVIEFNKGDVMDFNRYFRRKFKLKVLNYDGLIYYSYEIFR